MNNIPVATDTVIRYVYGVDHNLELAYVVLETPNAEELGQFVGEIVGLVPGEPTPSASQTWRNDDKSQRIVVQNGPANDAIAIGLNVGNDETLDALVGRLNNSGFKTTLASPSQCAERRVSRLAHATSPFGVTVELVTGHENGVDPYTSELMPGGFYTDGVGLGHAVFATTAFEETHTFLVDGLGFEQSDWLEMEVAPGFELEVRFYHCNARHHTLAIAKAPFDLPQTLHHLMFETNERNDVGAAFDRVWNTDLAIASGLGQHDNDQMFSFYVVSPCGFQVEVGHGAREIVEPWTDNRRYDQISAWGHQPISRG